jgi:hypothetical protein
MYPGNRGRQNWRVLLGVGLLLLHLTATAQEQTAARAQVESALIDYKNLDYERALEKLRSAQHLASTKAETITILLYEGIILSEMGRDKEAAAVFQAALHLHPTATLPVLVAPKIARRFEALRQQVQKNTAQSLPEKQSDQASTDPNRQVPPPSPSQPTAPATGASANSQRNDATHSTTASQLKAKLIVKLSGDVNGASLLIDTKQMGTLPLANSFEVEPGEHTIVVRRLGYAEFSRRVVLEASKVTELTVTLEAIQGVVAVTSEVPGTSVAINGQPLGKVPLSSILLKPGSHTFTFSLQGYEPFTKTVDIKAGRDYTVAASMKPTVGTTPAVAAADAPQNPNLFPPDNSTNHGPRISPTPNAPEVSGNQPWFKRWYVWAGVGAVVTAATVGTLMATQRGASPALTHEDVCSRPCDGVLTPAMRF